MAMRAGGLGTSGMLRGRDAEDATSKLSITNRRMLRWFYRKLAPYWVRIMVGVFAMLTATAAALAIPLVLRDLFDDVIIARNLEPLKGLI